MDIVFMLMIGALAGWLGSLVFSGRSLGLFGNVIAGILGSAAGYWLLGEFDIKLSTGIFNTILTGVIGAIVILIGLNLFFPGRKV